MWPDPSQPPKPQIHPPPIGVRPGPRHCSLLSNRRYVSSACFWSVFSSALSFFLFFISRLKFFWFCLFPHKRNQPWFTLVKTFLPPPVSLLPHLSAVVPTLHFGTLLNETVDWTSFLFDSCEIERLPRIISGHLQEILLPPPAVLFLPRRSP